MFKNYFKVALRNLLKQKGLSFINVFGLSAGLACFILFMLYAVNEFSFDRFHKNAANIYRVYLWREAKGGDAASGSSYMPMPLGPAMKQDLPGVETAVRFRESFEESFIKTGNKVLRERMAFADPQFFSVFSFPLVKGDPASALNDLHNVVLTEASAKKLFGNVDPVGKTIDIKVNDDFEPFVVTGIAKEAPSNSTITFNMVGNFNYLAATDKRAVNNWNRSGYQTFVQLKAGSTLPADNEKLVSFRQKYYPDEDKKIREDGWKGKGPWAHYGLQPLQSLHTNTSIGAGGVPAIDVKTVWILLGIATGVLLIACINFTTLAIGRSAGRAKEVGVRKVIGGNKKTIVLQFLTEALLLTLLSAALGFVLVKILLPFFNQLSGRQLVFSFQQFPEMPWMITGLVLLVGLLAGSYPALVMSGFKPVEVLKTKVKLGGANFFTKALVTVQFTVSAGLVICTCIIMQQLHYMQDKNPGFNKENIVVVDAGGINDTKKLFGLYRQKVNAYPEVKGVTSAELSLGEGEGWSQSSFKYNNQADKYMYEYFIDNNYLQVMGMKLLAGRNFNPGIASDSVTSVIINEAMMKEFGWTFKNAVGQLLKGYNDDASKTPVVIGVVKDFNFLSFSSAIEPQMFQQFSSYQPFKFLVRIAPGDPTNTLAKLQSSWKDVARDYPFKYSFLDDNLNRFYAGEKRWSNIIGWAGGISIFLACLGLLGLAALAVINRTKEMGIRKVLGATLTSIISLLSKDFLKLVIIAFVIATPVAWYFMHNWLQDYPYRINIEWWVFAITGFATVVIALVTVSFQAIKAALANPVESLRSE